MLRERVRDQRLLLAVADQGDAPHLVEIAGFHLNKFDRHPASLGGPNQGGVIERFALNRSKLRIPKHFDAKFCSDVIFDTRAIGPPCSSGTRSKIDGSDTELTRAARYWQRDRIPGWPQLKSPLSFLPPFTPPAQGNGNPMGQVLAHGSCCIFVFYLCSRVNLEICGNQRPMASFMSNGRALCTHGKSAC
jgi:hypothetical protein